ncbi:conserved hypothetical protein [Mesorhizobium sp. STM 4661]|nr:conserved hypothetical protein [Mesorhizobium sp. STM 4661]
MFARLTRLRSDWLKILQRAWSVRLMIVAIFLSGLEVALPFFEDLLPVPRGVFGALSGFVTIAALWARITVQKNLPGGLSG